MGNGSSSRRHGSQQSASGPLTSHLMPPPPGYMGGVPTPPPYPSNGHQLPYYYHPGYNVAIPAPVNPQYFQPGYGPTNGQYLMSMPPPPGYRGAVPYYPHSPPRMAPQVPVIAEHQKASTVRNDVNLNKATLRLEKDDENPGHYLVAFSFDATVSGSISIFFLAKEGVDCSLTPMRPDIFTPVRFNFEKGLGQKFRQASGTGVSIHLFDDKDLSKEGSDNFFPLVVRMESVARGQPVDIASRESEPLGGRLPKWVNSQTTHAVIENKDGDYHVRVVKQIIWVDGVRYELQQIYGIANSAGSSEFDENDAGKECVICLSEPRDTTVLPCRHMCMCSECAKVLRFQTNRCPICRTPVERLLEIKVPKV
ncbi:hypothetical protein O6H91_08G106800 [Diphasiastrum complanatum]|uniref:Uncharacterized protein n=6 Tax=Diphasiastrum complanatum TaxID=34168 RepID=A0ACC2D0T6_DIPCM|nr:hypothetical protein O6H91_08G106800 [Diphasiastrum complanatum]KAJ7547853.1 hypothetical protein O6H91_08G106800 [Diphasiastrum complanatum]KAJ7547854.1 hypothetical protein O6H91_08G106800 [Diphasiastrum complanatum]KAJ7547855.1 hypothetical protein O6H91_08G106800 [Diphasiastrum complanatum]KAJ7547857.1 hypothetical protein O6H91_08G106800 [Diphasiastrum complanatum]